ncbi:pseudaminic acid synthase [Celerinatantimonas diazotrophica]|uniref:N-acetylneuraminate synthase n=1 Tax=Celerinatantimonas diazotrophica TaxID=412034 RepID=A0A4R1JMG3_9GAMM|nr:pseudaminic acid synthase [Celerinatantimonas diazotrophica]TCK52150.1 N-acetylneuraminate synthase [Celerinatantimonas diazotrophica]CAG9296145.1 Pseudaminic acid synthase [Celerinatantimonas diazotrophica]
MNSLNREMIIDGKVIGRQQPVYIIAEMSTNHGGSLTRAKEIIHAAAECGADAIKLQTYTADTLTLNSSLPHFQLTDGLWAGQSLYELYEKVAMPWEWHQPLLEEAQKANITLFSSPFDRSAVEFLEQLDVPAYKIASAEIIEVELIEAVAATGKPVIISTGGAAIGDIQRAINIMKAHDNPNLCLLKCTSAYPAPYDSMNLTTIAHLAQWSGCPVGLSDHSLGISVPVTAVALGACVIEKHFMLDKSHDTADQAFSLDPSEFAQMVQSVRQAAMAIGQVDYPSTTRMQRAIYAKCDMPAGTILSRENIRTARPGGTIAPRHFNDLLGRVLRQNIKAGECLRWEMI